MKIPLPFNLLPHLEGTSIASCFRLRNQEPENHTVIELPTGDMHDFLVLLKALESELQARCLKWQKQASKSPVGLQRRAAVEKDRQAVHRAIGLIEAALADGGRTKP
jgi:hypothetical protein